MIGKMRPIQVCSGCFEPSENIRLCRDGWLCEACRPKSNAEIEAMLDAAHGVPFTDEQVERILKKAMAPTPPPDEPGAGQGAA